MNDAPKKQPDAKTTETQPAELAQPHFDEIAVLTAQPVESIAPRAKRRWFAVLEEPRTLSAIVFISVMMGIATLALTLQWNAQTQVGTAATEIPTEQVTPETESHTAKTESQMTADTEEQKERPRHVKSSKAGPRVEDDNSMPKARRVGVIYGRSSDRP